MHEPDLPVADGVGSDRLRSAALHQMPYFVIVVQGPELRIAAINQRYADLLAGFDPIGLPVADVFIGAEGQGVVDMFGRAMRGEPVELVTTRFAAVTPDGQDQELFLDADITPLRDRQGRIVAAMSVARDVTKATRRRQREQAAADELTRRYLRATDVIAEVQRALLPTRLPVLPAVDLAASYALGGAEQAAGGDWFDVLALGGDTIAAVVGDVVGHGVDASAIMAQLRAVALERLQAGATVTEVVQALDRFVQIVPAGSGSTVCVVVLDVRTGELAYCCAGHPPPLIAGDNGESAFLDPSSQGPIGEPEQRRPSSGRLDVDEVLLLYTDGIVERPGVPATRGVVELSRIAAAAVADQLLPAFSMPSAVDRATTQVLERLTRQTGATDDVTLLALRQTRELEPFHLDRVLGRTDVADVRASLRAWFRPGQVAERSLAELDQIVTELVENAVEHAYGATRGPVVVDAELAADGVVTLRVRDRGPWRPPPRDNTGSRSNTGNGIGLALVQQLSTALSIAHEHGTEVSVRYQAWKQSHTTQPRPPATPQATVADVYLQQRHDHQILHVRGQVDAALIDELRSQLALCTLPEAPDLVIDLEDVTMLSSAAISVLRDSLQRADSLGVRTSVRCRPGTVAQQVLALAAIATTTEGDRL